MPAFSFKAQFIPKIMSGEKTHTIRRKRKNAPRAGQQFYGYYAMRTKQCRKLFESTITKVGELFISAMYEIMVAGEVLSAEECEALAIRDGFDSFEHMKTFWPAESLPFDGHIIHWKPFASEATQ